jgi:hypothetical protein
MSLSKGLPTFIPLFSEEGQGVEDSVAKSSQKSDSLHAALKSNIPSLCLFLQPHLHTVRFSLRG